MDPLEIFKENNGLFQRQVLPGPTSRKNVPRDMSLLDAELNKTTRSLESGTDYVTEYVKQEEKELLESNNYYTNDKNNFEVVSHGTEAIQDLCNNTDTLKIYNTYDFTHQKKNNLSITSKRDQIVSMIETNSVVVIRGPTGCGKTTQVPQFILDSCYKKRLHCNIIVTQPRRIAAISIAKRVSEERDWPVGTLVGYQVGLINHTCNETRLTYCTTAVLLNKLIKSKSMLDYTHIVLDEVHERDQDMDFLLLVIRKLLRTNSRMVKVILMSATFQVDAFAKYFSSPARDKLVLAPIIEISKRSYFNIGIYYLCQMPQLGPYPEVSITEPSVSKKMMEYCVNLIKILDDVDMKADDANYDPETKIYERHVILVFLPGINEIEEMHNLLSLPKHEQAKWDVVVLHSSITNEEQQRIFHKPPHGHRRVILSTNIAESSITVPDVKYVMDFCLTKQLVIDPKTNFQSLELTWASKANCEQRAGRTGRVMDGRVYRLVPEEFYNSVFPKESPPEILRAPLANVVLKTKLLDMGEPKAILALSMDPPDLGNIERTILLLKEAGALIDKPNELKRLDGELTDLGRVMANLPVDIHLSKLIMLGHAYSILNDAIVVAASLAVKDMFNSPFQQKMLAYNVRLNWAAGSCSDCIAFLQVYKVWIAQKARKLINDDASEKRWAARYFVQIRVLREVKALITELTRRLESLGIRESEGVNKVIWKETDQPIVLKFVIAGAFYPNYFIKHVSDAQVKEHDGIRMLNGLDPSTTVFVQGWPMRQPGLLYAKRIQEIFAQQMTSSNVKVRVSFDNSSRVYVQFLKNELGGSSNKDNGSITKKISQSVYKAIRMRHVRIPLEIPILREDIAIEEAEKQNLKRKKFFIHGSDNANRMGPRLPGLRSSRIPIIIYHVESPGRFWIQICDSRVKKEIDRIQLAIESNFSSSNLLPLFSTPPDSGTVVIAPYEKNKSKFYSRAIVEGYVTSPEVLVQVFFIDYGFSRECRLCDLRRIEIPDVADAPALAIECTLAKVESTPVDNLENWSEAAYDFFWMLVHKPGKLHGDIYSIVNGVMALEVVLNTDEGEISVNKSLVDKGFAIEKQEGYFSRFNHDLRMKQEDLTDEQCFHYEQSQYSQDYMLDDYPDPPSETDCTATAKLKGPFSPLEIRLKHLTIAGRDKEVKIGMNSVNAVLLDTEPEDPSQRLLVAGCVSQSAHSNNLTLYNTTLMPRLSGLSALIVLIFAPAIELRRDIYGTRYIGALCGLGFHPQTKISLFPEHDIELYFDTEITIDDLQYINRLRHWMNIGMQISYESKSNDMEETIICQNRIKDALLNLIEKTRTPQTLETIQNFNMWNLYDDELYLRPNRSSMIVNSIYKLHNALELDEANELHEFIEHLKKLRALAIEDPRRPGTTDILCKVCQQVLIDVYDLRKHLFSKNHREKERKLGIQF